MVASLNRSRTREAPTPTYSSMKSEPVREKKGTFASPATALARRVFPVPGGAHQQGSFGEFGADLQRISVGCAGNPLLPAAILSPRPSPATSLKVTPVSFCTYTLALLLPTPIGPPLPPILLNRTAQKHPHQRDGKDIVQDHRQQEAGIIRDLLAVILHAVFLKEGLQRIVRLGLPRVVSHLGNRREQPFLGVPFQPDIDLLVIPGNRSAFPSVTSFWKSG